MSVTFWTSPIHWNPTWMWAQTFKITPSKSSGSSARRVWKSCTACRNTSKVRPQIYPSWCTCSPMKLFQHSKWKFKTWEVGLTIQKTLLLLQTKTNLGPGCWTTGFRPLKFQYIQKKRNVFKTKNGDRSFSKRSIWEHLKSEIFSVQNFDSGYKMLFCALKKIESRSKVDIYFSVQSSCLLEVMLTFYTTSFKSNAILLLRSIFE